MGLERRHRFHGFSSAVVAVALTLASGVASATGDTARGKIVFTLAAGCGCHTGPQGPVAAGGGKVPTPFGTFYGTNITPDAETGIGHWSDAEIEAAIRSGVRRDGSIETPAMPYYQFAGMSDADVGDLIAYLRSLPAVRRSNQAAQGALPLARFAYRAWRLLFFRALPAPQRSPSGGVERGHYLVNHVSICTDCHTPRNRLGAPESALYLAGNEQGPGGQVVPNITPSETGIADWSVDDIVTLLTLGMKPDFDNVQGLMGDAVDGHGGGPGYKDAPPADLRAIAEYLKTIQPIEHEVEGN
jgi:mono/diheme cytochrome c family protein